MILPRAAPRNHSISCAQLARKIAPRLGLNKAEVDTVEWLVRYHLLMSDMAQKRDISDHVRCGTLPRPCKPSSG